MDVQPPKVAEYGGRLAEVLMDAHHAGLISLDEAAYLCGYTTVYLHLDADERRKLYPEVQLDDDDDDEPWLHEYNCVVRCTCGYGFDLNGAEDNLVAVRTETDGLDCSEVGELYLTAECAKHPCPKCGQPLIYVDVFVVVSDEAARFTD